MLALPVYFLVLWLVVIPGYPFPLLVKAALGFLLAGLAAGAVTRRRGWLAGLLGFVLVLILALVTIGLTLGVTGLGPAFLINGATANGGAAAVGKVQGDLLRELIRLDPPGRRSFPCSAAAWGAPSTGDNDSARPSLIPFRAAARRVAVRAAIAVGRHGVDRYFNTGV